MKYRLSGAWGISLIALALVVAAVWAPPTGAEERVAAAPKAFETPEALAEALVEAASNNDDAAIKTLVGAAEAGLVQPGGDPSVAQVRAKFAEKAKEFWKLRDNEDGSKTLVTGNNRWPFPVPFRKTSAGWGLDVASGKKEMLARRIGRNELNAIKLCRTYIDAQVEYAKKDRDGDRVREYAQKVKSSPGKKDGLYWPTGDDGDVSPLGPLVESALEFMKTRKSTDPVGGYYWKILTGQGRCAPGGAHPYIINGNMIAGCALIGFPAEYGQTGIMTFMVSHHGRLLERDIGPGTANYVNAVQLFSPDSSWQIVKD